MPVPVIQIPNLARTDSTIQASMSDGGAPFAALGQVGAAIGKTGKQYAQFQERKERAKFIGESSRLQTELRNGLEEYKVEMEQEQDTKKWQSGWTERLEKIKTAHGERSALRGDYQARLSVGTKEFEMKASTDIKVAGERKVMRQHRASVIADGESLLEEGEIEQYNAKIREGMEAGLLGEEEGNKMIDRGEGRMDYYEASSVIESDPRLALEELSKTNSKGAPLNFTALSDAERRSLKGAAEEVILEQQANVYESLTLAQFKGEYIHPDEIMSMIDTGALTKREGTAYINGYHSAHPQKLDMDQYSIAYDMIMNYDPLTAGKKEDMEVMGAMIGLEQRGFSALKEMLDSKKNPESVLNSQATKDGMKVIDELFSGGAFGNVVKFDNTFEDPAGHEAAQVKRGKLKDELIKFANKNPDAGQEEIASFIHNSTKIESLNRGLNLTNPNAGAVVEEQFPDIWDKINLNK